ncbi:7440_t:CDS:1, partial [Acaulospora morrowiae]
ELVKLQKEHNDILEKMQHTLEAMRNENNEQKRNSEGIIQQLRDDIERVKEEKKTELEDLGRGFKDKLRKNELNLQMEFKSRNEMEMERLSLLHNTEKERLIETIRSMQTFTDKVEHDLVELRQASEDEKRIIKQDCEREIDVIRTEHTRQMDAMLKGETKVTFTEIRNQQERQKRESEKRL